MLNSNFDRLKMNWCIGSTCKPHKQFIAYLYPEHNYKGVDAQKIIGTMKKFNGLELSFLEGSNLPDFEGLIYGCGVSSYCRHIIATYVDWFKRSLMYQNNLGLNNE